MTTGDHQMIVHGRHCTLSRSLIAIMAFALVACSPSTPRRTEDAATAARRVAQEFVDGYYHQFPEEAYEVGYPDTPMDRLGDRGAAAKDAWRAREDAWLAEVTQLDTAELAGTDAAIPYAFTRDRLAQK